jgi:hypothetical protein
MRNLNKILVEKSEGEDNIRRDLTEIRWGGGCVDWIHLA